MQKLFKKNKKGMTLIEVTLAIAVLSITIMASTAVSVTYLKSRSNVKKYQSNNEELSMALNYLAKDIRMSSGNPISGQVLTLTNNATNENVRYEFIGAELKRNNITLSGDVTGAFRVSGGIIPRVTIRIQKNSIGILPMTVQTTVSMRTKYLDEN